MAAPAGNKFWQNRTRHGREKIFASAQLMWAAAEEYFEWCDNNPWINKEAIKSGDRAGTLIDIPTQRPYTLSGLCVYIGCNEAYFRTFKAQLPKDEEDFNTVISEIEQVIYTQKFEGAAVGTFNANIIARDLGLKEKSETELSGKDGAPIAFHTTTKPDLSKFTDEELKTILQLSKKAKKDK